MNFENLTPNGKSNYFKSRIPEIFVSNFYFEPIFILFRRPGANHEFSFRPQLSNLLLGKPRQNFLEE